MEPEPDSMIGTLFAGRFRVEARLGSGGMGAVYLARHEVLHRHFALKVIRKGLLADVSVAARFRREARAASRVDHPRVPRILDFGHDEEGRAYLVMEYVQGRTLAEALRSDGPFATPRVLAILAQIADALQAAHTVGVLHRDLKPSNIILTNPPGQPDDTKVLDFGLAKIVGLQATVDVSVQGDVYGTAEYVAPERCADVGDDPRSDLYSLGVLGFELLVGHVPFSGPMMRVLAAHVSTPPPAPSLASGRRDIPRGVDALLLSCLAKKPDARPPTAAALAAQLRALAGSVSATMIPPLHRRPAAPVEVGPTLPLFDLRVPDTPVDQRPAGPDHALRALEELAYALRDRDIGSPAITALLAQMLEAIDGLVGARAQVTALQQYAADLETSARLRESRLTHALGELEHELAAAFIDAQLARQLRDRRDAVSNRVQQIYFELSEQQDALEEQQMRGNAAADRAAQAVEASAAELRGMLRRACPEAVRAGDAALDSLCREAGL